MTIIGFASVRGAPGVTTTALLVAGALAKPAALVEADLAGGVLAVRYGLGREPGLTTLAAANGQMGSQWRDHAQDAGGVAALVGPDSPTNTRSLWNRAGRHLGRTLAGCDATVIADLGRLGENSPLLDDLALLVLLVRPVAEHLVALSHTLATLDARPAPHQVGVVLVGDGAYRPADVSGPLGVDVLAELPHDRRAAEALNGSGSAVGLGRSGLFRSVAGLAATLETALVPDTDTAGATR